MATVTFNMCLDEDEICFLDMSVSELEFARTGQGRINLVCAELARTGVEVNAEIAAVRSLRSIRIRIVSDCSWNLPRGSAFIYMAIDFPGSRAK
jgi:hypothetical protein